MAKAQVKLHFIELGIPAKIQYARDRVKDMDGNPYFPEPDIELKKITEATDDLEKKYLAAQGGVPAQTALQNEAEALWDDLLRKTAGYVSRIADGNVVVITSAGFTPTDIEPSPAAVPSKPQNLVLTHGQQSGTIFSECEKVPEAEHYVTLITDSAEPSLTVRGNDVIIQTDGGATPAPGEPAQRKTFFLVNSSTSRKTLHGGLVSGTRYYVWKFAVNAAGKGPDSDRISIVAP